VRYPIRKDSQCKNRRKWRKCSANVSLSKGQFDIMAGKPTMEEFFQYDADVCLSCPLAMANGAKRGDCYTREFNLFRGFKSMLRSIRAKYTWDEIPELTKIWSAIY
jgi:hypothetical protein